jgi:hypothetical protein
VSEVGTLVFIMITHDDPIADEVIRAGIRPPRLTNGP